MGKNRLEAFSDGVLAIIITIMVLELKVPHGNDTAVLEPFLPVLLSYVLSFVYVGIYWNNHHHLLHTVQHVRGPVLWANLHLLFWLSLFPVTTGYMGENHFAPTPTALYGVVLLMAGVAYFILQHAIIASQGENSLLARALGNDIKGKMSLLLYAAAIPVAFWYPWISNATYVLVALIWLVPDRRIERVLGTEVPEDLGSGSSSGPIRLLPCDRHPLIWVARSGRSTSFALEGCTKEKPRGRPGLIEDRQL